MSTVRFNAANTLSGSIVGNMGEPLDHQPEGEILDDMGDTALELRTSAAAKADSETSCRDNCEIQEVCSPHRNV